MLIRLMIMGSGWVAEVSGNPADVLKYVLQFYRANLVTLVGLGFSSKRSIQGVGLAF